jgi:hypothetical protein
LSPTRPTAGFTPGATCLVLSLGFERTLELSCFAAIIFFLMKTVRAMHVLKKPRIIGS